MQTFQPNFLKWACALVLLVGSWQAGAQTRPSYCPQLSGLPDTFFACKNTQPLLPIARIDSVQSGTELLDTFWTPATTLTRPDSIATQAYVDLTSINYILTLESRRPNILPNPTFDLGNTSFETDYFEHVNTLPMQQSFYKITDDPAKANPTFASIPDYGTASGTGGNGLMMVVNGSNNTNKVVYRQVLSLLPGQSYDLLAQATSVTPRSPATLQWRVNGVLQTSLNSPRSLTPIVPQWSPVQAIYTKPLNRTATLDTLEIINYETEDIGNDFALDDITVRPLCIQKDSVYVKAINLRPLLDFGPIRYGCGRDTVDFIADTTVPGTSTPPATVPDRYYWSFGDGTFSTDQNPRHIFNNSNQDSFIVKLYVYKDGVNPNGTITCVDSVSRVIRKRPAFHAGFTQDKDSICRGDLVSFRDTSRPNTLPLTYYFGTGDSSRLRDVDYTFDTAGVFEILQVVTDPYGCKDTARNTVVSIGPADLTFSLTDTVVCEGQTIRAQTLIDSSYQNYTWDFGDGRMVYDSMAVDQTYLTAGNYNIVFSATHNICPNVSKIRPLTVLPTPRVNLGNDTFLCPTGQPILLQNLYPSNLNTTKFVWNTGDETPQILVRHDGTFYLKATNLRGCSTTDTVVITRNCFLDIPNVFSPNSDGESDYFLPRQLLSKGLMTFKMTIFNRWGQQIFETARTDGRGWDGKFNGIEQPVGVYLYFIEATLQNGKTERYEGNLTLLR